MSTGAVQGTSCERNNIWQGIVEWTEEAKNPTDTQKQTRHVPCQVSAYSKDEEPELKADTWPPKLIMQFIPRQLVGNIDGSYLKHSKSIFFHPTPCEALESLKQMMCSGFAGCIHFTSAPACEIKILILFCTAEKKTYLGFIPNDQTNFVDHLRKLIQQETISHASMRQGLSCINQSMPTQVPQTVTASQQAPVSVSSITQQIIHPQTQGTVSTGTVQRASRERHNIWQGILEWIEKAKNPTDAQNQTRHVPCQVLVNLKNGEPELKADTWPPKLIMQLMPKQLIGNIGGSYLKNSKSVYFHMTPCEASESLIKMMSSGFAGCVHFTSAPSNPACEIKVLILLYTAEKKTYLGFIPNDQTGFVDRLRKVIHQQKTFHASMRQGQANPGPGNTIPAPMPTTGTQGGILMSQTNTMAMGGGQIRHFL